MWKLILATSVQFYLDVFLSSLYRQVERSETGAGVILPEIMPPKSSGVALPISSKPVSKAASRSFVCGFPWTRIRRKGKPPVGHFFHPVVLVITFLSTFTKNNTGLGCLVSPNHTQRLAGGLQAAVHKSQLRNRSLFTLCSIVLKMEKLPHYVKKKGTGFHAEMPAQERNPRETNITKQRWFSSA